MKKTAMPLPNPHNLELQWEAEWEQAAIAGTDQQLIWARKQLEKLVVIPWPAPGCGWFQAECPVCGDLFCRAGRSPRPLVRAIRNHLVRSSPPSAEQYAHLQIGDRLRFGNDLYEVFEEPQRPLAYLGRSGYEKVHTFYVVLRRLTDGKFFRTLINQPDKLRQIPRPSGSTIKPRRRIPHFQIFDQQWHTVYDTDYPSLAARAVNRLLEIQTLQVNLDSTGLLSKQFDAELRIIKQRELREIDDARCAGKRYEKAFSVGLRYPWPPDTDVFGGYSATFNIIDRFGKAICSTDSSDVAGQFWKSKDSSRIGLVISGHFDDPEDISDLLTEFKETVYG